MIGFITVHAVEYRLYSSIFSFIFPRCCTCSICFRRLQGQKSYFQLMIKGCGHHKPAIDSIQIINVEENKTTKERLSGQKKYFSFFIKSNMPGPRENWTYVETYITHGGKLILYSNIDQCEGNIYDLLDEDTNVAQGRGQHIAVIWSKPPSTNHVPGQ